MSKADTEVRRELAGLIMWAVLVAALCNLGVAEFIDRLKHPELTETQLFFRIPKQFVWDFSK
jgi:hypothetical protein